MKARSILLCIVTIILIIPATGLHAGDTQNQIALQNKKVKTIAQAVQNGKHSVLTLENTIEELESVPPKMSFHYDLQTFSLVAVSIVAGHETWSKSFHYYYDPNGEIIKYLEIIDRPDNPPRSAIIYGAKGRILWKNIAQPAISPSKIKQFFKTAMHYQKEFSRY